VTQKNPQYALETGFCTGRSTYAVLNSAKNLKKMVSIDINFDYIKPHGRRMREVLTRNFPALHTIEDSSKKILNTVFMKENFRDGIDWFTVDGDHSYKGCLYDLKTVFPYMNKGGIIIIDDYKSGPPNGCDIPDVTKACDDFHKIHPEVVKQTWYNQGKGFCIFTC
jgi:predicted O-methyltransferase YrrM